MSPHYTMEKNHKVTYTFRKLLFVFYMKKCFDWVHFYVRLLDPQELDLQRAVSFYVSAKN